MADRISALQDEVLCNILSFLPTQHAIATCVLSKRWRSLWLSVPTLYFDYKKKKPSWFRNLVYATMLARDVHQPIKTFRLICYRSSNSDVKIWINAAIQRGVEHLDIEMFGLHNSSLNSIFSCRTLVVLKLNCMCMVSYSVDLPSLKTLYLTDVQFSSRAYFIGLLFGCPILEDLEIKSILIFWPSGGVFKSLPKLVRANISNTLNIDIPLITFSNVEFLRYNIFQGAKDIPVFPNLTHLELILQTRNMLHSVFEIFKHCSKLQNFVLVGDYPTMESACDISAFPNFILECTLLRLRKCSFINYNGFECEVRFVKCIMQNSPSLRTMTISSLTSLNPQEKLEMLKEISLCSRSSTECELSFE